MHRGNRHAKTYYLPLWLKYPSSLAFSGVDVVGRTMGLSSVVFLPQVCTVTLEILRHPVEYRPCCLPLRYGKSEMDRKA